MSKADLLRIRPALIRAVIPYVEGPVPSTSVDPELANDGLLEELPNGGLFQAAYFEIHSHRLATAILAVRDDKPLNVTAQRCMELWGADFHRRILEEKHFQRHPARYLGIEWRRTSEFAILVCRMDGSLCELVVADTSMSGWDRLRGVEMTDNDVGKSFKEAGWIWALSPIRSHQLGRRD